MCFLSDSSYGDDVGKKRVVRLIFRKYFSENIVWKVCFENMFENIPGHIFENIVECIEKNIKSPFTYVKFHEIIYYSIMSFLVRKV